MLETLLQLLQVKEYILNENQPRSQANTPVLTVLFCLILFQTFGCYWFSDHLILRIFTLCSQVSHLEDITTVKVKLCEIDVNTKCILLSNTTNALFDTHRTIEQHINGLLGPKKSVLYMK